MTRWPSSRIIEGDGDPDGEALDARAGPHDAQDAGPCAASAVPPGQPVNRPAVGHRERPCWASTCITRASPPAGPVTRKPHTYAPLPS